MPNETWGKNNERQAPGMPKDKGRQKPRRMFLLEDRMISEKK